MKRTEITVENSRGLEVTLSRMHLIELENSLNHFFKFWTLEKFSGYSLSEIPRAVWQFVSKNFTYLDDPTDELLIGPRVQVQENIWAGDCDDFSLFIKTVLTIFEIPANYLLAGDENGFSHIVVELTDGTILDGTNNKFNYLDQNKYTKTARVIL